MLLSFLWSCLYLFCAANAIPQTLLYDYAVSDGLQLPKGDEVSSPEIKLTKPIVFYGRPFDTIYVSKAKGNIFSVLNFWLQRLSYVHSSAC